MFQRLNWSLEFRQDFICNFTWNHEPINYDTWDVAPIVGVVETATLRAFDLKRNDSCRFQVDKKINPLAIQLTVFLTAIEVIYVSHRCQNSQGFFHSVFAAYAASK